MNGAFGRGLLYGFFPEPFWTSRRAMSTVWTFSRHALRSTSWSFSWLLSLILRRLPAVKLGMERRTQQGRKAHDSLIVNGLATRKAGMLAGLCVGNPAASRAVAHLALLAASMETNPYPSTADPFVAGTEKI